MSSFVTGHFEWTVPAGFFRMVQGTPREDPTNSLVNAFDPSQLFVCPEFPGAPVRTYRPLSDYTGLFLTFADIPASESGVIAFADLYGLLGVAMYSIKPDGAYEEPRGEPLAAWIREIEAMRKAVGQWLKNPEGDLRATHPDSATIETANRLLAGSLSGGLRSSSGRPEFVLKPTSLLGAMWLQLAMAVAEEKMFRRCEGCRTWFEVATGAGRVDKRFCGDSCRSRKYRSRQNIARRLFENGNSVETVARLLKSEPKVIEGWVRGIKKG